MNYELAKQLKDAGFPQMEGLSGRDVDLQINKGFPTYICEHHNKCGYTCGTRVYYPKLGELIEACTKNNEWFELKGNTDRTYSDQTWIAIMPHKTIRSLITMGGQTPEEAVAKLWLEFKK